ncbi:hypothetical protein C0J52_06968 [Blattella germanica]|nr:hypothetical protein C0J52_06968 [Blattella germanica]
MNAPIQIMSNTLPNGESSIKQEFSPMASSHVHTPAQRGCKAVILTRRTSDELGREPCGFSIAGERGR